MTIHAVADGSGFYLCRNAEDAKELCMRKLGNNHYGGDTMFGWLFNHDAALDILGAFDTMVYVLGQSNKVLMCTIKEFREIWDEAGNSLAFRLTNNPEGLIAIRPPKKTP